MATYTNLTIDQGETFSFTLDLNIVTTGTDADITGFTAAGSVRKTYASSTRSAAFSIVGGSSGESTFTSDDSTVVASLTSTQTSDLKAGRYVYDIELRNGTTITRVLEGQIEVTPRVTRSTES